MKLFEIPNEIPEGPGHEALYKLCCAVDELRGTDSDQVQKLGTAGIRIRFQSIHKHIREASMFLDQYHDKLIGDA